MIVPFINVGGWMNVFNNKRDYKDKCKHCAYLQERHGKWYCDLKEKYCEYIDYCSED